MQSVIEEAVKTIKRGGVILYPTDTIWGLGCDAFNEDAVNNIFKIKKRDKKKNFILLTESLESIKNYIHELDPNDEE